jgi:hypothetical protein
VDDDDDDDDDDDERGIVLSSPISLVVVGGACGGNPTEPICNIYPNSCIRYCNVVTIIGSSMGNNRSVRYWFKDMPNGSWNRNRVPSICCVSYR